MSSLRTAVENKTDKIQKNCFDEKREIGNGGYGKRTEQNDFKE